MGEGLDDGYEVKPASGTIAASVVKELFRWSVDGRSLAQSLA